MHQLQTKELNSSAERVSRNSAALLSQSGLDSQCGPAVSLPATPWLPLPSTPSTPSVASESRGEDSGRMGNVSAHVVGAPDKGLVFLTPVAHGWIVWWKEENGAASPYHALRPGAALDLRARADCGLVFVQPDGTVHLRNFHMKHSGFVCDLTSKDMTVHTPGDPGTFDRKCSRCSSRTPAMLCICLHCGFNCHSTTLGWFSVIPVLGVFPNVARAALSIGNAVNTGKDKLLAVIDTFLAALDIALAPLFAAHILHGLATRFAFEVPDFLRALSTAHNHTALRSMRMFRDQVLPVLRNARDKVAKVQCCSLLSTLEDESLRLAFLDAFPCGCRRCLIRCTLGAIAERVDSLKEGESADDVAENFEKLLRLIS
eukprot:m.128400 g.128400  ORF g.128400 m.128400 type:complete len:372 (+) comp9749_c0_seq2:4444-5559(+)